MEAPTHPLLMLVSSLASALALALATAAHGQERNDNESSGDESLETIVVTATRNETLLRNAPASISVVRREELQLISADDVADALMAEAGVNITSVGMSRRGVSFRGMPVEHTLYLVDGRRINSSNGVIAHSDYELNWVPDSAIERIEVVRGPMSSLYGANALGGVINIITRPPTDRFSGELSTSANRWQDHGGDGEQKSSLYLSGPIVGERLNFNLSGQLFERDKMRSDTDPNVSTSEARESQSGQGTVFWQPKDNQRLILNFSFSDDEREQDLSSPGGYYTSTDRIDREQYSLSYNPQWENGHAQINAYHSELQVRNRRSNGVAANRPRALQDDIIDGHIGQRFGEQHLLTIGGQLRDETLEDESLGSRQEASALHRGLFLQDEWQVNPDLMLVSGVSIDKHEDYGSEIDPRWYAVYQLADQWTLKGGYGEGFRAPSLTELSEDYQVLAAGGRFWVEGNPHLDPERSASYELGLEYNASRWNGSLRVFENQLDGLVQTQCYVNCGIRGQERRNYLNLDESLIRGSEFSISGRLRDDLDVSLNYTYLDTEDLRTGLPLENRPRYMARINLTWQPLASTRVSWRSEFNGRQYAGSSDYLPTYHLHHLDVSFEIGEYLTLYAGVENLFDEHLADKSDLFTLIEPGREFRLGLTARF